jgi:hypothetical protein
MQIKSVDQDNNLFVVSNIFSADLVDKILSTSWLELPTVENTGQNKWLRRKIVTDNLPWHNQFISELHQQQDTIFKNTGRYIQPEHSWFWLDEPGFTCAVHTDGELPGSLHLMWIGSSELGTTFYNTKNNKDVRKQFALIPNTGYVMINCADSTGYRLLQWHGMPTPVPKNTFRLTSYTLLSTVKY